VRRERRREHRALDGCRHRTVRQHDEHDEREHDEHDEHHQHDQHHQ
jgi:hypothetical protein